MALFNNKVVKKLTGSIVLIVILSLCLSLTTFALVYATVEMDISVSTGKIGIVLNEGSTEAIIREEAFAPGMTVERDITLRNTSTDELGVYYKVYFENISGGLAELMEVTVRKDDTVLYSGLLADLTEDAVGAASDILEYGGTRTLTVAFTLPEDADLSAAVSDLSFDLSVKAVQVTNNPNREF